MKAYWDSSALVAAAADFALRARLRQERGITRTHALAEIFSALTGGNLALRLRPTPRLIWWRTWLRTWISWT